MQVKKLAEVNDWLEPFRKMWEDRFSNLDSVLHKLKSKKWKVKRKRESQRFEKQKAHHQQEFDAPLNWSGRPGLRANYWISGGRPNHGEQNKVSKI
jgi:hypothetical protein